MPGQIGFIRAGDASILGAPGFRVFAISENLENYYEQWNRVCRAFYSNKIRKESFSLCKIQYDNEMEPVLCFMKTWPDIDSCKRETMSCCAVVILGSDLIGFSFEKLQGSVTRLQRISSDELKDVKLLKNSSIEWLSEPNSAEMRQSYFESARSLFSHLLSGKRSVDFHSERVCKGLSYFSSNYWQSLTFTNNKQLWFSQEFAGCFQFLTEAADVDPSKQVRIIDANRFQDFTKALNLGGKEDLSLLHEAKEFGFSFSKFLDFPRCKPSYQINGDGHTEIVVTTIIKDCIRARLVADSFEILRKTLAIDETVLMESLKNIYVCINFDVEIRFAALVAYTKSKKNMDKEDVKICEYIISSFLQRNSLSRDDIRLVYSLQDDLKLMEFPARLNQMVKEPRIWYHVLHMIECLESGELIDVAVTMMLKRFKFIKLKEAIVEAILSRIREVEEMGEFRRVLIKRISSIPRSELECLLDCDCTRDSVKQALFDDYAMESLEVYEGVNCLMLSREYINLKAKEQDSCQEEIENMEDKYMELVNKYLLSLSKKGGQK